MGWGGGGRGGEEKITEKKDTPRTKTRGKEEREEKTVSWCGFCDGLYILYIVHMACCTRHTDCLTWKKTASYRLSLIVYAEDLVTKDQWGRGFTVHMQKIVRVKQRSKVACVSERLETVLAGPELRPGHRSATGEMRGKRQRSAVFFDILGQGHCRPSQHWNCLKRSIRETFIGGTHNYGLFRGQT